MAKSGKDITVAVADDHSLLRNALAQLIQSFDGYRVLFEADNGKDLGAKIQKHGIPEMVLLDVNMPEMNGFETTQWLYKNYPQVKVLALSMLSDERSIIKMFRLGAKGYILKNADPEELKEALDSIYNKDAYISEYVSGKLISGLHHQVDQDADINSLTPKEREFLVLTCSEMSYKEIAEKMFLSPRTIDDYRTSLFNKLKVHSHVGLAMYAIKMGIVEINSV